MKTSFVSPSGHALRAAAKPREAARETGGWRGILRPALDFRPMSYSGTIALLLALSAVLSSAPASANEWQLLEQHDGDAVYLDRGSVERSGPLSRAWVLKSFGQPITLGHDLYPHQSQKLFYEINCEDRTLRLDKWVLTDESEGHGNVVWLAQDRSSPMEPVARGSTEELLARTACAPEPLAAHLAR